MRSGTRARKQRKCFSCACYCDASCCRLNYMTDGYYLIAEISARSAVWRGWDALYAVNSTRLSMVAESHAYVRSRIPYRPWNLHEPYVRISRGFRCWRLKELFLVHRLIKQTRPPYICTYLTRRPCRINLGHLRGFPPCRPCTRRSACLPACRSLHVFIIRGLAGERVYFNPNHNNDRHDSKGCVHSAAWLFAVFDLYITIYTWPRTLGEGKSGE